MVPDHKVVVALGVLDTQGRDLEIGGVAGRVLEVGVELAAGVQPPEAVGFGADGNQRLFRG